MASTTIDLNTDADNIKAYSSSDDLEVTVIEGKLVVSSVGTEPTQAMVTVTAEKNGLTASDTLLVNVEEELYLTLSTQAVTIIGGQEVEVSVSTNAEDIEIKSQYAETSYSDGVLKIKTSESTTVKVVATLGSQVLIQMIEVTYEAPYIEIEEIPEEFISGNSYEIPFKTNCDELNLVADGEGISAYIDGNIIKVEVGEIYSTIETVFTLTGYAYGEGTEFSFTVPAYPILYLEVDPLYIEVKESKTGEIKVKTNGSLEIDSTVKYEYEDNTITVQSEDGEIVLTATLGSQTETATVQVVSVPLEEPYLILDETDVSVYFESETRISFKSNTTDITFAYSSESDVEASVEYDKEGNGEIVIKSIGDLGNYTITVYATKDDITISETITVRVVEFIPYLEVNPLGFILQAGKSSSTVLETNCESDCLSFIGGTDLIQGSLDGYSFTVTTDIEATGNTDFTIILTYEETVIEKNFRVYIGEDN